MPMDGVSLKRTIMRRVYAVWFLRRVAPGLALELVLVIGVAVGVLTHISPRAILMNALAASSGLFDFVQFFIDNFFVKSIQSRLLAAAYAVILAFFIRDFRSSLQVLKSSGYGLRTAALASGSFRR